MKAIAYSNYGSADVLRVKEVAKPVPLTNEDLIKVHPAEATKADCELRSFNFAVKWFWLPLRIAMGPGKPKKQILGGYFSGQVEAVGKDVARFGVGDPIFGSTQLRMGAYGEYLGGLNTLHFMRKANIQPGEKVLINGAGGSIGTFAVQIAKAMGAEVTAVDSTIKQEMLRWIGADHFVDYSSEKFTQGGASYDVIFNMVARSSYSECVNALKPRGR